MHPKDKIPSQLKQNIVCKCFCLEENCNLSYTESPANVWKTELKNTTVRPPVQFTNTMSNNHSRANMSHFKIIDQDSKQVAREAREAIILESTTIPLTTTQKKCTSWKSSTTFLDQMDLLIV